MSRTIVREERDEDRSEVKSVELRLKATEAVGVPLVFCALGLMALVKPDIAYPHEGASALVLRILGFLILVFGVGVGYYMSSHYKVVANTKGIRWRGQQHFNEIEWNQIKAIQVQRKQSLKGHADYTNLVFTDLKDGQIGQLALTSGTQKDRQKLINFAFQQVTGSAAT